MTAAPPPAALPANAIVILLDSLNRHLLGAYGSLEFATPNLDRVARRALRFERHYAGSLPCMPARHDLLCGALDFLWRPWGSIEIWEQPITTHLRGAGVVTQLISDHPHLFEIGGENYHCDFTAWDYQRGHESDAWRTRPDPSWLGAPSFHRGHMPYDDSRGWFRGEADFPGPRTMAAAARWLEQEAPAHQRFLLFVDEFDPHEPFDTPEPYASLYDPAWRGPHLIWPPYLRGAQAAGVLTAEAARQVRACYGAKLTMIDAWLGRVLDVLDRRGWWETTAVIVCTDHGHYLGEKDIWGKPAVPVYEPLGHIPLLIAWPGVAPRAVEVLTTTLDVPATLCELFGVDFTHRTHGRSLLPLIRGEATRVRDWALSGIWGREVHLVTDERKYARAPVGDNAPLGLWSNRWSTMPIHRVPHLRLPLPDERAALARMPGSTVPVIHQPFAAGDLVPFWAWGEFSGNHLYDLGDDPQESRNLAGGAEERDAVDALRAALQAVEAPAEQFERLGLT
ncbi:MAG TPA: sulfatase-like hydrolase/transferase [Candidatus Dormibacteraeota bacterium]|nr:sulfatase-like hydrolase/transferase [Candidatus Dormibacteraeota bacterium]